MNRLISRVYESPLSSEALSRYVCLSEKMDRSPDIFSQNNGEVAIIGKQVSPHQKGFIPKSAQKIALINRSK